eukprot:5389362-Pyramimonas_sp.AAC.1
MQTMSSCPGTLHVASSTCSSSPNATRPSSLGWQKDWGLMQSTPVAVDPLNAAAAFRTSTGEGAWPTSS